ncbi:MAG TPA: DUF5131 family protein [Emticicia sp.]
MLLTNIEWADFTHNFWNGCQKISAGCKFCYMHRLDEAHGKDPSIVRRAPNARFYEPLLKIQPGKVFTCSMSDFFIEEADPWRDDAWDVIRKTPHNTWQILTKRPERILEHLPKDWGEGYPNVWLGVTVEDQKSFNRVEILSKIPSALRFISAEPLLEDVDFLITDENGNRAIDSFQWVILGGESGNETGKYRYRLCMLRWLNRVLRDLKDNTEARVFVKQLGSHLARKHGLYRHGENINQFPKYLQVREMPDAA